MIVFVWTVYLFRMRGAVEWGSLDTAPTTSGIVAEKMGAVVESTNDGRTMDWRERDRVVGTNTDPRRTTITVSKTTFSLYSRIMYGCSEQLEGTNYEERGMCRCATF